MHVTRIPKKKITKDHKLLMVAILHRHGDRAPIREHLYPNSVNWNNDFYPVGESNLTNLGKTQLYEVGKKLRTQYDSFLGPYFLGQEVHIITSSIQRTQMSTLALSAGLFPPQQDQIWNKDLNWQPIVYTEVKKNVDCMIRSSADAYPEYVKLYKEALKSDFNQNLLNKYCNELAFVGKHAGYKKPKIRDLYYLHQSLTGELSMGLPIPDWTKDIYPEKLEEIAVCEYDLATLTIPLRKYQGGTLARYIVEKFCEKIQKETKLKFLIFSGHESTIGYQLRLLDIKDNLIPRFGSHIIWELWKENDNYFVKILYENFEQTEPKKCLYIPFEEFSNKMKPYYPSWRITID